MEPTDRLALTVLTARYAQAVDRRDATALAALFTPDAELVLPPVLNGTDAMSVLTGREALVSAVIDAVSRYRATRHVVEQQVLETISRDRARGETYCTAHHIHRRGDEYRDRRVALRYRDDFARTADAWLFSRRELVVDFTEHVPVTVPAAHDPEV
ncbi:nuclear transport factor 2 family protein [Nocardia spumae]|uniref:nuclear transport factor 2 family protein n=1 Tax=Nocardia spumae TaxID=2887190 RepID=UPI001D152B0D|nr:nuclear transport factor 2 family protein [Nocardia spumae]